MASDPIAAIEQLQNIVRTLAPSLSPQVLPKGVSYGLDLILSLCKTEEQREKLKALVRRNKPLNEQDEGTTDKETEDDDNNLQPQIIGAFDTENRVFSVQKVVWMHERDAIIHEFTRFIELQLENQPVAANKVVQNFLEVNGHKPDDIILAQQCLSAAFALQTLLRAFPRLPIAVNGKVVEITEDTDIAEVFSPLLALKVKKKKATTVQRRQSKKRKSSVK